MNYIRLIIQLLKLRKNEKLTPEKMKEYQQKKLRKLLDYAYENSPYYKKTFERSGLNKKTIQSAPLSAFPVISKSELMEHFDSLVTSSDLNQHDLRAFDENMTEKKRLYKNQYHVVHSSGSTGIPRYFVYDQKAWEQMIVGILRGGIYGATTFQFLRWLIDKPRVLYIAATDGRYGGVMAVGDGIAGLHVKQMELDINTPLYEWEEKIREFKPNFVIGYPSAIKVLGELVEHENISLKMNRIVCCGEPLSHGLRSYIEKTFATEVVNFYGASESLILGVEIKKDDGMYLFDDLNLIEVINGEMYLTCLYNYIQPLIRYHISDRLVIRDEITKNQPFTKADVILCRDEDVIWFETDKGEKEFLHPLSIEGFCVEGLLDYQFRQMTKQSFEIVIEAGENADKSKIEHDMTAQMSDILKNKKMEYICFRIRFTDHITADVKTGKKPLVIPLKKEEVNYETNN